MIQPHLQESFRAFVLGMHVWEEHSRDRLQMKCSSMISGEIILIVARALESVVSLLCFCTVQSQCFNDDA